MRIAIAKEGELVSAHFGHCEGFELFDIENGKIILRNYVENPGHRPGFLPLFLSDNKVNTIIAGGMGATAQDLFEQANISVIVGAQGRINDVINDYIDGKLISSESVCTEHSHEGHCHE